MAIQVPTRPDLGELRSIMRLILHKGSARTSRIAFFRVKTDRISVYPPPPKKNGAENLFFHLVSPALHFRYPPPRIWGC